MSATIVIIDTSVFVEILALPGLAKAPQDMQDQLEAWIVDRAALLLPIAVIIETGNHIAQLTKGRKRRSAAERFVEVVQEALDGNSPFAPTPSFAVDSLREWLPKFVGAAANAQPGAPGADLVARRRSLRLRYRRTRATH